MIIIDLEYRKTVTQGVLLGGVVSRVSGQMTAQLWNPSGSVLLGSADSSSDSLAVGSTGATTENSFFASTSSSGNGVNSSGNSASSSTAISDP